jgi:hypothetical protein
MPNVSVQNLSQIPDGDFNALISQIQAILQDFQDQLNDSPSLYGRTDSTQPKGLRTKDFVGQYNPTDGSFSFGIFNGQRVVPLTPAALNISFSDVTGSLSATQHGDLSAASGTFHAFPQISGSITRAQHGDLGGGTLHIEASSSVSGFLSKTPIAQLKDMQAADTQGSASTLAIRTTTGGLRSNGLYDKNGALVVGTRITGWHVFAPGGDIDYRRNLNNLTIYTVTLPKLAQVVNALILDLGQHGLFSS